MIHTIKGLQSILNIKYFMCSCAKYKQALVYYSKFSFRKFVKNLKHFWSRGAANMQNAMYWKTAHIENTTLVCFKLGNGMHGAYEEFSQAIERVL